MPQDIPRTRDARQDLPASLRTVVSVTDPSTVVVATGSGRQVVQLLSGSKSPRGGDSLLVHQTPSGPIGVLLPPVGLSGWSFLLSEGAPLALGIKGVVRMPFKAMIEGFYLYSDQIGSVEVDLKRCLEADYAGWADTAWTAIPAPLSRPAITAGTKSGLADLSLWDTELPDDSPPAPVQNRLTLLAGDKLAFEIVSVTTITALTIALEYRRLPE